MDAVENFLNPYNSQSFLKSDNLKCRFGLIDVYTMSILRFDMVSHKGTYVKYRTLINILFWVIW